MRKFICSILLFAMLLPQASVAVYAETVNIENVAIGKKILTDVPKSDAESNTEAMVDGKIMVNGAGETRWYVRKNCADAWFNIYLGNETKLYYAMVYSGANSSPAGIITDFKLQYRTSNGWEDIDGADISGNEKMKLKVTFKQPVTTDAVRFVSKTASEFRIREFELYGEVDSVIAASKNKGNEEGFGIQFQRDVSFLSALGVLDDNAVMDENEFITRGRFADIAMRALGYREPVFTEQDGIYEDVDTQNPYYQSIMNARKLNAISGEQKYFYPNKIINENEMLKIIMCLMGYSEYAEMNGGYPTGYIRAARTAEVDIVYASDADNNITNGEAVRFICETFDGYPMCEDEYNNGTVKNVSDRSVFENVYNGKKGEGVVEANEVTYLYQKNSRAAKGEVIINGERYKNGGTDAAELLGFYVDYYSVEKQGTDTLVYVCPDKKRNSVLTLTSEDIVPESSGIRQISYRENNKTKEAKLSDAPYILINGKFDGSFTKQDLDSETLYILLVDWDNDDIYDFASIYKFGTFIVGGVDENAKRIRSRDGEKAIDLLNDGDELYYTIKKSGQSVPIGIIKEDDVVCAALSSDGRAAQILVSGRKISGTVEATDDDGNVVIGGNEYPVYTGVKINLNDSGTFYIDSFGKIAGYDTTLSAEKYGLVLNIAEAGSSVKPCVQIKLLDESGAVQTYNAAKKYKLNKQSEKSENIIGNPAFFDSGSVRNDLIRYNLNQEGEINEIITVTDRSTDADKSSNRDILSLDVKLGKVKYKSQLLSVSGKNTYAIDINRPIFFTTTDSDIKALQIEESVYSGKASEYLSDYTTINGTVSLYDIDEYGLPGAVVVYDYSPTMIPTTNQIAVVKKALGGTNENGEDTKFLKLFKEGAELQIELPQSAKVITSLAAAKREGMNTTYFGEYYVPEYADYNADDLKAGDIILYSQQKGKITYWQYVYKNGDTVSRVIQQTGGDSGYYANLETMFVRLKQLTGSVITFVDGGGTEYSYLNDKIRVTVCDSMQKDVYQGTIDDIVNEVNNSPNINNLFVRTQVKAVKDIVIYK